MQNKINLHRKVGEMIEAVLLDLDGTVYMGDKLVPGADDFIRSLNDMGIKHLFVTNRANRTPYEICTQLHGYGIECEMDDVLTSAQATAQYIEKGTVYCVGEEGLWLALSEQGLVLTDKSPDYVVVSFDRAFDYDKLETACGFINSGSKYVATNPDKALKIDGGIAPGTGAIIAAVTAGSGVEPVIIGKPERLIMDMALKRLGLESGQVVAVGDNIETDIPAGINAGIRTALVLTGITKRDEITEEHAEPTWLVDTFEELEQVIREHRN